MARKNANGDGSRPRKRPDGRWEARYWVETPSGRKRRSVYGSSRKDCAEKLAEAISAKEDFVAIPANITVSEFLKQYLEAAREKLRRRTWEGHEETVRVHLVPSLGHLKLKELTRSHVQSLYTAKRVRGLSPGTVRRIHAVLSAALSAAVRWRLLPYNVCKDADPPRTEPPEIRPLNQEEARAFMVAAEGERHHALFCLALTTGMRRGEILGLRWGCLDLALRTVHVRQTLVAGRGSPTFESPKSAKSRRSITLTTRAVDALELHRERQGKAGFSVEDEALVFTSIRGTPLNTSRLRLAFKAFLVRAGLPDIRFHDLRHTCATLLLCQGVHPKIVQELLGHTTINITLDTYSHVLPGIGDAAASAMDDVLE